MLSHPFKNITYLTLFTIASLLTRSNFAMSWLFSLTIYEKGLSIIKKKKKTASVFAEEAQTFPPVCIIMYTVNLLYLAATSGTALPVPRGRSQSVSSVRKWKECATLCLCTGFVVLFVFLFVFFLLFYEDGCVLLLLLQGWGVDQKLVLLFSWVIRRIELTGRARKYQAGCMRKGPVCVCVCVFLASSTQALASCFALSVCCTECVNCILYCIFPLCSCVHEISTAEFVQFAKGNICCLVLKG